MRLINTYSLHLEEFFGYGCPTYAILSHTWGEEETSYQDWLEWESGDAYQRGRTEMKSGFLKIKSACHAAQTYGHEYLWVDTNCIDKKSSAELSEAINSMFSWYRDSLKCLVYLEDYPTRPWGDSSPFDSLSKCRWFTRGWTLQELLAPKDMVFFNREWGLIGTKMSLSWEISTITCIDEDTLKEPGRVHAACAARKMSWASSRQTTRTEDLAYCLLGLFSINMPLLYGEGSEAFRRLQEEIIRVSTDQSLFAWDWPSKVPPSHGQGNHCVTMLAPFPSVFANRSTVIKETPRKMVRQPRLKEFAMTNLGLNISLPLVVKSEDEDVDK
ncbi:Vegetative incompatibility protein HET-E-1 [Colletotrichum viniferum]|nr:Vegetative incompatibility protein HET-E-1 [Colletotrichum viniferum]